MANEIKIMYDSLRAVVLKKVSFFIKDALLSYLEENIGEVLDDTGYLCLENEAQEGRIEPTPTSASAELELSLLYKELKELYDTLINEVGTLPLDIVARDTYESEHCFFICEIASRVWDRLIYDLALVDDGIEITFDLVAEIEEFLDKIPNLIDYGLNH